MRIGRSVRFGRAFAFGPFVLCLILGGTVFVVGGCDGGAATSGKNEVVPVDQAKTQANQDMIKGMYDKKAATPATKK